MMNLFRFLQPDSPTIDTSRDGLDIWRERILSLTLMLAGAGGTLAYLIHLPGLVRDHSWSQLAIFTVIYAWLITITIARQLSFLFRARSLVIILYMLGASASLHAMLISDGRVWFSGFAILTTLFLGFKAGLWATAGSAGTLLLIGLLFKLEVIPAPLMDEFVNPDNFNVWLNTTSTFLTINLMVVTSMIWLINKMNTSLVQLAALNLELEQRGLQLRRQTQVLENQARIQGASARISQAISSILEPDILIQQVVKLICEQFDLDYVSFFQVDETGKWAILKAASGEADKITLERGHHIQIGTGNVGWSIANAKARVANAAEIEDTHQVTPELLSTRSEAAIPLRSRGSVLGALTIHSTQANAFDDTFIATLQIMADQVAVALDNARLFAENQIALEASQQAYSELSQEAWGQFLQSHPGLGFLSTEEVDVVPADGDWEPAMQQAVETNEIIRTNDNNLAIPIVLRHQVLGVIRARKPAEAGQWTSNEIELINTLVNQLEIALESARLYQDTQQRAIREQLTSNITDKLHRASGIEQIIETALEELSEALGASRTFIRLGTTSAQAKN